MQVSAILDDKGHDVKVVGPDTPISVAVHRMSSLGIGCLVVVGSGGRPSGVLAERDVVRGIARHGDSFLRRHVRDVVGTRSATTCSPSDDITTVMVRMTQTRERHLPVVDDAGALVGLVSIGDLVKGRLGDLELQTHVLRDAYVAHR
ncbi:MAG TPA: CBS domain-containing protein [Acidimicrobiales bacterium]|nr:CBS domain-containing protein [Acidimicrobiales bacterium]